MAAEKAESLRGADLGIPNPHPHAELRDRLLLAVRRICPPAIANRAEDIVQEGLLKLMMAERGETRLPSAYLRAVAYSTVIDELRRARARCRDREEPADPELPGGGPSPEDIAADRQLGAALRDCMGRLPEPRRVAVTLHLQGHDVPQAAAILGWSASKTRNLVYRGLADVRECLEKKGARR